MELNEETVFEIMLNVDDNYLEKMKTLNQFIYQIYNDDFFWKQKVIKKFKEEVNYKDRNETWKSFYNYLVKENENMYKDPYYEFTQLVRKSLSISYDNRDAEFYDDLFIQRFQDGDLLILTIVQTFEIDKNLYDLVLNIQTKDNEYGDILSEESFLLTYDSKEKIFYVPMDSSTSKEFDNQKYLNFMKEFLENLPEDEEEYAMMYF